MRRNIKNAIRPPSDLTFQLLVPGTSILTSNLVRTIFLLPYTSKTTSITTIYPSPIHNPIPSSESESEPFSTHKHLLTISRIPPEIPSTMRASILILGFLTSLSYALPKADQTCREVNHPSKHPLPYQISILTNQPTLSCSKIATWGQPMACCYPLMCATEGNSTIGVSLGLKMVGMDANGFDVDLSSPELSGVDVGLYCT